MALTTAEEAQTRELLAQQAAILSLADSEPAIISNLGATDVSLSDLGAATVVDDADLLLIRQGVTDKSVSGLIIKGLASVPDASETVKGIVELATIAEAQAGTDTARAVTPAGMFYATNDNGIQNFRLTLTSGTPVTTSDVTGATTIYCTPYKGNKISLYSGSTWNRRTSAEFSLALGALTASLPYDVFCYDNSGTPTLEFLAWASDSARATALAYQDGVLVKFGAETRRYIGTFRTTTTTTTEDSAQKRFLWNYYNRATRSLKRLETTATWTYGSVTKRQANGNSANQVEIVVGVSEDVANIAIQASFSNSVGGGNGAAVGIGYDSITVPTGVTTQVGANGAGYVNQLGSSFTFNPAIGRHYFSWLEWSGVSAVYTFYGVSAENQSGIHGTFQA